MIPVGSEPSSPSSALPAPGRWRRLAIAVVLVWMAMVAWIVASRALWRVIPAGLPPDVARAIVAVVAGGLGVAAISLVCRVEGRRLATLGLSSLRDGGARSLAIGLGLGTALGALGLAMAGASGAEITVSAPRPVLLGYLALQLGLVFCLEAMPEELAFRGYLFTALEEGFNRPAAVIGQAVLFALAAMVGVALNRALGMGGQWSVGVERLVAFLCLAITLGLVRAWISSLWATIGIHLAFQAIAQLMVDGRLPSLEVAAGRDLETALFFLWLFIVLGGAALSLGALARRRWRREAHL